MDSVAGLLGSWSDLGGVAAIAAGVRAGSLDAVELAERALRRAEEVAELGAVVHLDRAGALAAAAQVGGGALAGVPVLVKEIIAVEGMPFTCGSRVFAGRVADADADVVRAARAAGAVIIGLSHSHEFAYGCTGTSNAAGPCRNPHDPSLMTGGSSAGAAAAVAAGIVPLAIGTDTAGSVRIPAALCGVVGAKPARGTLPCGGVFPLSTSLDHVGVLAGTVADATHAVAALSGADPAGPADTGEAPRIGVLAGLGERAPEVDVAFRAALDALVAAGAEVVDVPFPEWDAFTGVVGDVQGPEAAATHATVMAQQPDDYQPDVLERLRAAATIPGWRYVQALARMAALRDAADHALDGVDAVLLPTVPVPAPPLDATHAGCVPVREALLSNTRPANVTGHPAISLPLPTPGPPVGLQVIAHDDRRAFRTAGWIEQTLGRQ
ncbi:amidase [Pseudonocardia sp. TRM90224]|uniref:amidase n=1 Tax=Pseudonocardia sp. TRM90224 TaxID=2812678 RepID=UPI001E3C14BF|nr:amidase [Pseudonocardia sp. TRM90224]